VSTFFLNSPELPADPLFSAPHQCIIFYGISPVILNGALILQEGTSSVPRMKKVHDLLQLHHTDHTFCMAWIRDLSILH